MSKETHFNFKDSIKTHILKELRKMYNANTNQRKAEVAVLHSDKSDFRTRTIMGINMKIT